MSIGIEKLALYTPPLMVDALALGVARGRDPAQLRDDVMMRERAVIPGFEDTVTLAVNAARRVLEGEDLSDISLLIVNTESAVDYSKPVSTWVHRLCGLPVHCRNFEIKHACYGGVGALQTAVAFCSMHGGRALVVSADLSRPALGTGFDFVGGACAVAMLVGDRPDLLALDPAVSGYWTTEVPDVFRPTSRRELGDNQLSLFSYLDALDGVLDHVAIRAPQLDYAADFARHIYHAPFPGMTRHAHRTALGRAGVHDRAEVEASFSERVAPGLSLAARLGAAYGASNFVCVLGLLQASPPPPGSHVSLFAYGSGCQAELYAGVVGEGAAAAVAALDLPAALDARVPLTIPQYERIELMRDAYVDVPDFEPDRSEPGDLFAERYTGRGLLVLERVKGYVREYGFS